MSKLATNEVFQFLVILTILLAVARIMGELFKKLGMPAIIGELLGGIIIGPSFFGYLFPVFFQDPKLTDDAKNAIKGITSQFPTLRLSAGPAVSFDALTRFSVMLLLFIAGMEVKLENIKRRGKAAAKISLSGIIFPLAIGFAVTWFFYSLFFSVPTENKLAP